MVAKKKFLTLAMAVGVVGLAFVSYTIFLTINNIIKP